MKKKLMLIVNPAAGRGGFKNNFAEALNELDRGGYTVTVFFTSGRGDAINFAAEHGQDYDVVACIGGDGTLSEVIAGVMQCKKRPPLGYFPMGTANDIATTLGLPKNDCLAAARRLVNGEAHPFDIGTFGDKGYFAYIAAFGAFTEVSYETPQEQKKALGHLAYVIQGAKQLTKIESIHAKIEYDEGVIEEDLLYGSMSNSTSVAGIFKLSESLVSLGDGMSELVLVKHTANLARIGEILDSVYFQRYNSEDLIILHTKHAKFSFDKPVAWTRDGEAGGEFTEIELSNIHCPVNLIF